MKKVVKHTCDKYGRDNGCKVCKEFRDNVYETIKERNRELLKFLSRQVKEHPCTWEGHKSYE